MLWESRARESSCSLGRKRRGRAHRSGERIGKVGLFSGLDWMRSAPQRTN